MEKKIFDFIKKNEQQFDSANDQFEEFFDDSLINKKNVLNVEAYFKKNFYKTGSGRDSTEQHVLASATQLDNLLRLPGVKTILCNRHNNINFDNCCLCSSIFNFRVKQYIYKNNSQYSNILNVCDAI